MPRAATLSAVSPAFAAATYAYVYPTARAGPD